MKKCIRMVLFVLGFLLCITPVFTFGDVVVQQDKLENVRQHIVFPELDETEKNVIINQARIFLKDLYVHRYAKMEYYFNHKDPVPAIEELAGQVNDMSTADMEEKLYRIFAAQRDLHLNYNFPSPYRDYKSFLPLTFTRTAGKGNYFQVRVSAVNEELFQEFAPGERVPEVGDELVVYNDKSIWETVWERLSLSMGANFYGGFSRSLGMLTYLNHKQYLLPEENIVTLVLKPYKGHHSKYSISLPWIAEWSEETPGIKRFEMKKEEQRYGPKLLDLAMDDWQQEFNSFIKKNNLESLSAYPDNPSSEPTLTWGIIDNASGHFGYLRLDSFVPENGVDFTVSEIRRLLLEELADTDGLIFDVRNNGGGYISLADMLPQLFKCEDATVLKSRLLNTELNYSIFNESVLGDLFAPEWKQVINDAAGTGNRYTGGAVFTYDKQANGIGQVYYKPVAVMSNARSYSATDMFTSAMQDNGAAIIYGEDPTTGAGGANVITHGFFNYYSPEVFEPLPGNHEMRVSWRQTVRFGINEGELIEDYGCYADKDVSQTVKDVISGGQNQISKITRNLARWSKFYKSSARGIQMSHELYLSKNDLRYGLYVNNTDYVSVYINGEIHEKIPVFAYFREKYLDIELPSDLPVGQVAEIKFQGENFFGKTIWNLKRRIVVLGDHIVLDDSGFEMNFELVDDISPITLVNANLPEDGWNLEKPYLQIGYNPNYKDYVDSDAVLFFDLSERTTAELSFGLEFDTEESWDFVHIYVTCDDQDTVLFSSSGIQPMTQHTYDLSDFIGKEDVIVHFRFVSDSNTNAPGVKLSGISVN